TRLFINPAVVEMCARPSCRCPGPAGVGNGLSICPKGLRASAGFLESQAKVGISLSVRVRLIDRRLEQSNGIEVVPRLIGGLSLHIELVRAGRNEGGWRWEEGGGEAICTAEPKAKDGLGRHVICAQNGDSRHGIDVLKLAGVRHGKDRPNISDSALRHIVST